MAGPWTTLSEGLPGRWTASLEGGHELVVDYRMTARGSVLLETWMPGTPAETLTTFHLDGDRLMLTHYCGQGNQARLRLTDATERQLSFSRFDVTNHDPSQGVLTALTLAPRGDTLTRIERYTQGTDADTTTLEFTRTAAGSESAPPR
ncbi:MAG: hypothetical protein K0V04_06180 [Deltaproteobacteria bacterium]|nr:hypothetical protein [Deltaproteobacteria bacterium]